MRNKYFAIRNITAINISVNICLVLFSWMYFKGKSLDIRIEVKEQFHCWLLFSYWSVQFSCSVVSDSLRRHGLQHARLPCPSPTPRAYIHWVGDAIQPSHPLSSPSPPAFNLSQHWGLFKWVSSSHKMAIATIGFTHIGSGRTRTWLHPGVLTSVQYPFYYSIQNYVKIPLAHSTHSVLSGNRFNKVSVFICLGSCNKISQARWLK